MEILFWILVVIASEFIVYREGVRAGRESNPRDIILVIKRPHRAPGEQP